MPSVSPSRGGSNRKETLTWTSTSYFAEGLPWSVAHQIASEYLTAIGMDPKQVGYTSWLHATTSLKFVWSPIVDLFGNLRRWMIGMQVLMGVAVGLLAMAAHRLASVGGDVPKDTTVIWLLLVVVGVFSATHDIACDGYYMAALDKKDQARYSGARVAAFRAAMLVGSSGLVFLGGYVNWLLGFGIAGLLMVVLASVHHRLLPKVGNDGRQRAPKKGSHIVDAYKSFLSQRRVLLVIAFLLSYKMADVLMFSMSKVLLDRELGVPTDLRGILNSFSIGASILGAIVGGAWIARRSLGSTLFTITVLMAITEPLFVALAALAPVLQVSAPGTVTNMSEIDWGHAAPGLAAIGGVIVVEQLCGGMATAAQMVFIMRRCNPKHRAAHYAFATAIYASAQMAVGGGSGHFYEALGSVNYFWLVSALTLPAVVLSRLVPTD